MEKTKQPILIDSVDTYNRLCGIETLHPLITVVDHGKHRQLQNGATYHYELYALFLKQGDGCSLRYGREKCDYQQGTIVCLKPGQTVSVEWDENNPMPSSKGLLFHPDLVYGTALGRKMSDYTFFDYDQREALHLSEREQQVIQDLLAQVGQELSHPVDKHSQKLITDSITLMLDYCLRFYDRQFITRKKSNSNILSKFEQNLNAYFEQGTAEANGLPSVAYFAEKAFLSPGYFGDLIKKETGLTAQRFIQNKIIEQSKHLMAEQQLPINQIAYQLGFQYPQHFTRLFKQLVGCTPSQYVALSQGHDS